MQTVTTVRPPRAIIQTIDWFLYLQPHEV